VKRNFEIGAKADEAAARRRKPADANTTLVFAG